MKVLILGASGMLGSTLMWTLKNHCNHDVYGTSRIHYKELDVFGDRMYTGVQNIDDIRYIIHTLKPCIVINCIGIIKQKTASDNEFIYMNAIFPKTLQHICQLNTCKLIHYSTDCVFDGSQNIPYTEYNMCTTTDIYGISKYLGELHNDNAVTLRTSIIGHELKDHVSLIDWFLRQSVVHGYTKAIYSGLPVVEHAYILLHYVFPNIHKLTGLYHVSADPISKYDLLKLVKEVYHHDCELHKNDNVYDYKVLDGTKFITETGYKRKEWKNMIEDMYRVYNEFNMSKVL